MRIKSCFAFTAAALAMVSIASGESLRDALALAYETNPTIRAERARLDATRETRAQAWAGALPQISATGAYNKVDSTQTSTIAQDAKLDTLTAGVTAEQPIFTGFRNFNAIKQAGARIRAGGAQLVATEQQVLSDVATAYFNVQRNMAVYELNKQNVAVLLRQKDMAQARFDVGEITKTDVAQADARLAEARARLSNAQGDLAVARAAYAQLVGRMPGDLETVETLPELPESLETAQALARKFAPSLVGAQEQAEVSRRQVSIARGALLPSVSLTAGYQYAEEPNTFIEQSEDLSFGARASVPLFAGGANYSRVREAKALHRSDRARVAEAERLVDSQTISAWERLVAARAVTISAEASVEANRLALEGVRQEALVGTRTTLDVLNAEQELLNAEVSLVSARRDAQSAAFSLLAAVGVLTPSAIGIEAVSDNSALDLYER
ncbi:TolC family outer membrane protein [Hyphococcus flavus]|uniref:TolC family outer membrane protein n=1 Tax=Hyphococcus flavus TaxID=1866326 RepID=A0AAE9ZBY3_9PROT|nr:TolC family outer membrane protein [Hyphococcus flavus]WDI30560.1 TolC family outer membrane protein [Hyphococcus flavus]